MTLLEIYQKHLPNLKKTQGDEYKTNCPFHEDSTPSFFVNSISGYYYCFGCGRSGGVHSFINLVGDTSALLDSPIVTRPVAMDISFSEIISPVVVQQLHKNLMNDMDVLTYVVRERLISLFTIKKYMVGYDTETDRIAFPIKSRTGEFVNIKLHNSSKDPKSLSWAKGFGKPRLYPITSLLRKSIVICEGEFDCLLLQTRGINGITSTAGVSQSFAENGWCPHFKNHDVTLCFDSDEAGITATESIKGELERFASSIRTVAFPEQYRVGYKKVDITDFVRRGGDINKLLGVPK